MDAKDELLQRHIEGVVAELSEYFATRFAQIARIRPNLMSMYADLLYMQMAKVREVLAGEKMFGPIRMRVGDILASRDELKRHAVMGPIDQASILSELIPEQEEGSVRRPGFVSVRNMQAFYTSVDPSLGPVLELTDIWQWWDVLDAADAYNFKEQKKLIERRKAEEVTKALSDFYHREMGRRDDRTVTREELLTYEFLYLESLWKAFQQRRAEEKSFMAVLKRDPIGGDDSLDDLIITLSRHIAARQRLAQPGGLDDRLREYYAKVLKCEPGAVKAEQGLAHEDLAILRLREDLRVGMERGAVLGEPYDYKQRQVEEMGRDIENYRKTIPLVKSMLAEAPKAAAAATAPAAPAAAPAAPAPQRVPTPEPTVPAAVSDEKEAEQTPEGLFF